MNASLARRTVLVLAVVTSLLGATHPRDKSKPVRAAINTRYAQLVEAWRLKDPGAALALRHADFYAVQVSGVVADSAAMANGRWPCSRWSRRPSC